MIPNEGELQLITEEITQGEDWELGLFTTSPTLAATDNEAAILSYEASFSGYARKTPTRTNSPSTWNDAANGAPTGSWSAQASVAQSQYNPSSPQTWTYLGGGATVYGWFLVGATSGKLIATRLFPVAQPVVNDNTISFVPTWGRASVSGS